MKLTTALQGLMRTIIEEAERNPAFAQRVENAIGIGGQNAPPSEPRHKGSSNRRAPAVLDPIEAVRQGEAALRQKLAALSLEQLKDVVADYGMDPGKLVMKWKTPNRIIDRIVEFSIQRSMKGDAFIKLAPEQRTMEKLRREFQEAMFNIYRRAKDEAKYTANIFLQMLTDRGGVDTAKFLINAAKESDGYTALYERGRLDLTVEAVVVENKKWHELFEPVEIEKARKRLDRYGYRPKTIPS